jgi:S-adenosylmethionine synthetase|tara:strand:- start:7 stop:1209 length:1203 start_codon:yes stop_codon:yes gene_type:complete
MSYDFVNAKSYLFTSESVTEGHPDKICDQISDSVLDSIIELDPNARVACEVSITTGLVVIMGEITTSAYVDIPSVVRRVISDIGFNDPELGFDSKSCGIMLSINEQSPDISEGVSTSLEVRENDITDKNALIGAGDQGMMVGYACTETPELMPLPISLSHKLVQQLSKVRRDNTLNYLRPDGKSQITVEYSLGQPKRIDTVVVSTQHDPDISQSDIYNDVNKYVIEPIIDKSLVDSNTKIYVNPSGRFVIGGPNGDTGLTGRKILVDTYGGFARHGGGAFSGKDPTKVDRSGAYAARWVAKNLVAAGVSDLCEVQLAYAIGMAEPVSVSVETFGTSNISYDKIIDIINEVFDLRPAAIIEQLNLRQPIYHSTSFYGHFGRSDLDLPWERINKIEDIKSRL